MQPRLNQFGVFCLGTAQPLKHKAVQFGTVQFSQFDEYSANKPVGSNPRYLFIRSAVHRECMAKGHHVCQRFPNRAKSFSRNSPRRRDTSTKIAIYLEIPVSRSGMSNHLRFFCAWGSTFRRPHDQESFV